MQLSEIAITCMLKQVNVMNRVRYKAMQLSKYFLQNAINIVNDQNAH